MKLLHLNESYRLVGGAERYVLELGPLLRAHGHEALFAYADRHPDNWEIPGQPAYHIPALANGSTAELRGLAELIDREAPDVVTLHMIGNPAVLDVACRAAVAVQFVHSHSFYCPGGGKLLGRTGAICTRPYHPVACTLHMLADACGSRRPQAIRQSVRRVHRMLIAEPALSGYIVASSFMRGQLAAQGIPTGRVAVLPYFTDVAAGWEDYARALEAGRRLLFVGRLSPDKGLQGALRALSGLSTAWSLDVVGDGWYRPHLERLVARLGLGNHVRFHGWAAQADVRAFLSRSRLLILPSLWPEPFGIVGIEAMAQARPVVAFGVGGVREWLDDGETGWAIPAGDWAAFASRVEMLLAQPAEAARLGENGRRQVQARFSPETHVEGLVYWYGTIAGQTAARTGATSCES
ncbi:MAG: glycosyltransferase family 4 protein [Chloroflexi bacterium]|nr:glycosyltransferase family 4 protein [Chloroflexota bacterium]